MSRRFGRGDYHVVTGEGVEDDATGDARDFFVHVAAVELPEVISSFRADALPSLEQVWDGVRLTRAWASAAIFMATSGLLGLQDVAGVEKDGGLSNGPLAAWARRWNLSENRWFTIRLVLRGFQAFELRHGLYPGMDGTPDLRLAEFFWEEILAPLEWGMPDTPWTRQPHVGDLRVEPLTLPGWDPIAKTWGEYRAWIEGEILPGALADHKEAIEAKPGLARTPTKKYAERDFRWLARWQLGEEPYSQILRGPTVPDDLRERGEVDTVRRAVERAAELVGLTRRTESS